MSADLTRSSSSPEIFEVLPEYTAPLRLRARPMAADRTWRASWSQEAPSALHSLESVGGTLAVIPPESSSFPMNYQGQRQEESQPELRPLPSIEVDTRELMVQCISLIQLDRNNSSGYCQRTDSLVLEEPR